MKKNFKRTLAKVMAVALTVSLAGAATDAEAAKKKIELSKKSITVAKGSAKKVTIKNVKAKKVKKLTVKTTNKKVATVKKAGKTAFKVTGKKVGSANIKVTVKVKGVKKATKLTLKVKVTKKSPVAPAASASAAPAASASVAPAVTASAAPAATATVAPKADETAAPTTSDAPEASQAPVEEGKPTQPAKPTSPANVLPVMNLREEMATEWTTAGGYGTAIFETDDTVNFSSQPWKVTDGVLTAGSVYNNGVAWYLAADKSKVDLSAYGTVEITIKTDAEVKLMTWAGATDPSSFWDKNDTWGGCTKVENTDGTTTLIYKVADIFGNPKKATALGLTLKSAAKKADGTDDDSVFEAKTATIYSIVFKAGEAVTPAPSQKPDGDSAGVESSSTESSSTESSSTESSSTESSSTESKPEGDKPSTPAENKITLNLLTAVDATLGDTTVVESGDAYHFQYTNKNGRTFFKLPADLDLSNVKEVRIKANVPGQMTMNIFGADFTKDGEWWNTALASGYPFYKGSGVRADDGGLVTPGVETYTVAINSDNMVGNGGWISLAPNGAPDAVNNEEATWDEVSYMVYSIEIVLK